VCLVSPEQCGAIGKCYIYLMAIRTRHQITDNTWFITFTCYNWISFFEITNSYDLVYKWLKLINGKHQIKTFSFVIMSNHVHLLLYLTDEKVNLNTIIGNAKRFMAYDIIMRLNGHSNQDLLNTLASACTEKEKVKGQLHKVFEPSFDAKPVYTFDFFYGKPGANTLHAVTEAYQGAKMSQASGQSAQPAVIGPDGQVHNPAYDAAHNAATPPSGKTYFIPTNALGQRLQGLPGATSMSIDVYRPSTPTVPGELREVNSYPINQ
jgi:putative transposase